MTTKRWGVIVEWIRHDGMARMLMTGVIPTPLSGACICGHMLVNYCAMSDKLSQLLSEQCDNKQPLERLLK